MSTNRMTLTTNDTGPAISIAGAAGGSWAIAGMVALQLLTAALLMWSGEGILRWAAPVSVLLTVGLAMLVWRSSASNQALSAMVELLRTVNQEQGDLSRAMPEDGDEATREVARLFNQFMDRLRDALEDLRRHSIRVTLSSAHGRKVAEETSRDAGQQEDYSQIIYRSSEETTTAIEELSRWTNSITEVNSRNLETAQVSVRELVQAAGQIGTVSNMMKDFHGTVDQLETTSESIQTILGTVQGFAAQTNMLALNAAIEAARAGEQGRGFAVVADEVRDLAVKVRGSADEIGALLEQMIEVVSQTSSGTRTMISEAEQAKTAVDSSSTQFERMVSGFEATHSDLLQVSAAAEELSVTNSDIRSRSSDIRDLGVRIREDMDRSSDQTAKLLEATDKALHKLCQFRLGRGKLESLLETAENRRDRIQAEIERLHDAGVDMFDRNHRVIPDTNPVKHDVSYARRFQQACQHFIDEWARAEETDQTGALFCLPLDDKGYVAIHRSELSFPPTGDPKIDLAKSRHMRFFQNRNIPHMGRFRLQSYLRDTGEVMFNLSVPIEIHGRFWGGLFMGLPGSVFDL